MSNFNLASHTYIFSAATDNICFLLTEGSFVRNTLYYDAERVFSAGITECLTTADKITFEITYDEHQYTSARKNAQVSRVAWGDYLKQTNCAEVTCTSGAYCLVTKDVYMQLKSYLMTLPSKSRNPVTRLYFYLYFECHRHHNQFNHSLGTICGELHMNNTLVSKWLGQLVSYNLLERSYYTFGGKEPRARIYSVPTRLLSPQMKWQLTQFK